MPPVATVSAPLSVRVEVAVPAIRRELTIRPDVAVAVVWTSASLPAARAAVVLYVVRPLIAPAEAPLPLTAQVPVLLDVPVKPTTAYPPRIVCWPPVKFAFGVVVVMLPAAGN